MKRIISVITLMVVLMGLLVTGPVAAAEPVNVELKEAIEIAKAAFNFDTANLDFNSSYSESKYGKKMWYLNWTSTISTGSSISVSVDAATGEIINMSQWDNTSAPVKKLPKYTREEALKVAKELISKLNPDKLKDTELLNDYQPSYFRPVYTNDIYTFYFIRKINGIDFQDNGMQVQVDKNTLKVRYYSMDWDTVLPIPDSKNVIRAAAAKKIYEEKLGLELSYQMIYPTPGGDPKLILVYTQKNSNNPIDALTGEIVTQPYYGPMYGVQEKYAMGSDAAISYAPTPQEQKVIDDSSKYISKEKALELLSNYIKVDSVYKMEHSSLYGGYNNENPVWSFSWSYNDREKNTYAYISGSVDAVTGEIKGFNIGSSDDQYKPNTTPKYTKEQSREIAEKFLKEIQPEKFKSSEYREQYYNLYMESQNVVNYNMYYIRKENGISVPFNNLNVIVNAYTGKVTGFNMMWQDFEFPDAKGIISLDAAYQTLYEKHDLMLKYARMYNYDNYNETTVIRLLYMLDNFYGLIDAKSGQFIDYNGKPIKDANKAVFTDISGHKAENDIKLLVELGIIDSADSKFNPAAKILQKDFVQLLMKATQPDYYPLPYATADNSEYDRYYENAVMQNILTKDEKNPEAAVTRMEASRMMLKALGIGFVADLGNIFKLEVRDSTEVSEANKGYAAIASAMNLVDTSDGYFSPSRELTRAETASMLINYLKVDKNPSSTGAVAAAVSGAAEPAVIKVME